jgi:type II restriction enzyme
MFDVGTERYTPPPAIAENGALEAWLAELLRAREKVKGLMEARADRPEDRSHTEVQAWSRDLGLTLGYQVWVAANDRGRLYDGVTLATGCLDRLPDPIEEAPGADSIPLDRRALDRCQSACRRSVRGRAFDIYLLRHCAHARSRAWWDLRAADGLFLVAPDNRQDEVRAQLNRPAFSRVRDLRVRFLPYGELDKHRPVRHGMKGIHAIARTLY